MVASRVDIRQKMDELLGDVQRDIDITRRRRIFCNRSLRMANISLIGFDMDYTLALYQQESLEQLSMQLTLDKMIGGRGYPEEIRELEYDSRYAIRGVVIDKALGNVFKMDKHGHVGRVYHGFNLMPEEERERTYRTARIRLSSPRYVWIDTLFGLPEAVMYITLVAYYDARHDGRKKVDYKKLFDDIRASIDEAHRDDTLKTVIKSKLSEYVINDGKLAETLHKLRSSGKKTFVLTNSYWPYSNEVMKFLLDDVRPAYPSWRNYFDYVIVGGRKPGFFTDRKPFIEIDPSTGEEREREVTALSRGMVVQGGNIIDFEKMVGVSGDSILYVGDHIYGDVIKVKKSHTWRTAMVLQELDAENTTSERLSSQLADLEAFDRRLRNLQSERDYQALKIKQLARLRDETEDEALKERIEGARKEAKADLDQIRERWGRTEKEVEALEQSIDRAYNPYWGAMFRERHENSRFGQQVGVYADLYTSRVSNFLSYSPLRYFRAPRQQMPHE